MPASCSVVSDSLPSHGLYPTGLLCSWNSPGKNTEVGSHSLLQEIFPTPEMGLLYCRWILYHLSHHEIFSKSCATYNFTYNLFIQFLSWCLGRWISINICCMNKGSSITHGNLVNVYQELLEPESESETWLWKCWVILKNWRHTKEQWLLPGYPVEYTLENWCRSWMVQNWRQ